MESAVTVDTASVDAMRVPPVQGMQKPPGWVGEKWFLDRLFSGPELKVKKPAGLKTRPACKQLDRLGGLWLAWPLRQGLAVWRGAVDCQAWCLHPCKPSGG